MKIEEWRRSPVPGRVRRRALGKEERPGEPGLTAMATGVLNSVPMFVNFGSHGVDPGADGEQHPGT